MIPKWYHESSDPTRMVRRASEKGHFYPYGVSLEGISSIIHAIRSHSKKLDTSVPIPLSSSIDLPFRERVLFDWPWLISQRSNLHEAYKLGRPRKISGRPSHVEQRQQPCFAEDAARKKTSHRLVSGCQSRLQNSVFMENCSPNSFLHRVSILCTYKRGPPWRCWKLVTFDKTGARVGLDISRETAVSAWRFF